MGGGEFLCIIPIALLLGTAIGAVILRAGVSLFNTLTGASSKVRDDDERDDEDYDDRSDRDDEDETYTRRRAKLSRIERRGGVPTPNFPWSMLMIFVNLIVYLGTNIVLGLLMVGAAGGFGAGAMGRAPAAGMGQGESIMINIISAIAGFLTLSVICKAMLPTTFPRALGVAALVYVIYILIAVLVGVVLVGVIMGMK